MGQLADAFSAAEAQGGTPIVVHIDDELAGIITVRDTIKDTSTAAIAQLKELGPDPIPTHRTTKVRHAVASEVGIDL